MDHSYSIDTCLYSRGDSSQFDETNSFDSYNQYGDENSLKEQIEKELGTLNQEEGPTKNNDSKITILKRCIDNISKFLLSDKIYLIKEYFERKNTFEYSETNNTDFSNYDASKSLKLPQSTQATTVPCVTSDFSCVNGEPKTCPSPTTPVSCRLKKTDSDTFSSPESDLDPETLEKIFLLFVENTEKLAKKAIEDNRHLLADKLICNVFKKLNEVYGVGKSEKYTNSLDSQGHHPLFNLSFNLPIRTPDSTKMKLEKMSKDPLYLNNLAEKIFIFDVLKRFKMFDLTELCINFNQPLISKLWDLSVDSVVSKTSHNMERVFECRNSIFSSKDEDMFSQLDNLPTMEYDPDNMPSSLQSHQFKSDSSDSSSQPNIGPLNSLMPSKEFDSSRTSFTDSSRSSKAGDHGSKDQWAEELFMGSNETLRYILRTNRLSKFERVELLKGHFNLSKTKGSKSWVQDKNNRLESYYLVEKNCVSMKVRGKLQCDIITALTIITDTDMAAEWVPFLKKSKDLHLYSRTSRIFEQAFDYPMVGHKETLVYGLSTNVLDEANCVIITCSNPPSNKKDAEMLIKSMEKGGLRDSKTFISLDNKNNCTISGYTISKIPKRQNQKSGDICFLLFPFGDNETIMEVYSNVVQEVKIIPMKFITYLIRKVMLGMFKKIAHITKNFNDTKFADRKSLNSEFYNWMNKIYEDHKLKNPQSSKFNRDISLYTYDPRIGVH